MRGRVLTSVTIALALSSWSADVRADDDPPAPPRPARTRADLPARLADPDTADGRIDGDVGVVAGLGASFAGATPRGSAELRLRYLETAGVFLTYEDALGAMTRGAERVATLGLEMRPLFLARWVTGRDLGLTWLDLVIDSLGLELGAVLEWPAPPGASQRPGVQASLGLEVPLVARASGPWLGFHGGARWSDSDLAGGQPASEGFVSVTLCWHQTFSTPIVDLHDHAP